MVLRTVIRCLVLLLLFNPIRLSAQGNSSEEDLKGRWSIGLVTSAGIGVYGSQKDTELWLTGIRLGNTLTPNGSLEYILEIDPSFLVSNEKTVYGFGVTPLLFRWTFQPEHKTSAFLEFGAGILFTSAGIPEGISSLNFTPQGGVGIRWKRKSNQTMSLGLQYIHISNAGLEKPNPGINMILFQFSYTWLR